MVMIVGKNDVSSVLEMLKDETVCQLGSVIRCSDGEERVIIQ